MKSTFLINAANLRKGGGLQVAHSLLHEWKEHPRYHFVVLASPQLAASFEAGGAENITLITLRKNPAQSLRAWLAFWRLAKQTEKKYRPAAVLTIFGPALWRPRAPHLMGFANCLYLFSASRFIREDWPKGFVARLRYRIKRRVLLYRVRTEADSWYVETGSAKDLLSRVLNIAQSRVHVVPNALAATFSKESLTAPEQPGDERTRLLVIGALYPNKNLGILRPLARLLSDLPICFQTTLPPNEFSTLFGADGLAGFVENLGPLKPEDLPQVYRNATAVFFPTKLEIFSAVYLEAMASKRPILTSRALFAEEICGNAAAYFDPWDPQDAARCVREVLGNPALQAALVERGAQRFREFPTAAHRAATLLNILEQSGAKAVKAPERYSSVHEQ